MSGGVKLILGSIFVLVVAVLLIGLLLKVAKVLALVGVGAVVLLAAVAFLKTRR